MTDTAQVRMDQLADERRDDTIRAALLAAGYTDPPAVADEYEDLTVTYLPDGHRSIVTILDVWRLVDGWTVTVRRRQVDADGNIVESGDGEGSIFINRLLHDFRRWQPTGDNPRQEPGR